MEKRSRWQTALQLLLGLCLCLCIISLSVVVTQNFRPLYYADIHLLKIPAMSGLDEAEIKANFDVLIDYNSLFHRGPLEFPTLAMSESGRIHFEEVKAVFDFFGYTAIVTAVLSAVGILWSRKQKRYTYLKAAGLMSVIGPVLLGIVVAVNWDFAFVAFHKVVFNNDFWIFDAVTDPVITILPDAYFLHCAIMIFALVILGSAVSLLLHRRLTRPRKKAEGS